MNDQIIRREEMCPVRSPDRTTIACAFPSWSWVGWVGAVKSFLVKTPSDLIFFYLDGKRQLQKVDEADDQVTCLILTALFTWRFDCVFIGVELGSIPILNMSFR